MTCLSKTKIGDKVLFYIYENRELANTVRPIWAEAIVIGKRFDENRREYSNRLGLTNLLACNDCEAFWLIGGANIQRCVPGFRPPSELLKIYRRGYWAYPKDIRIKQIIKA